MIRFACPGCGATYSVDDAKGGKTGKCPKCSSQFVIPAAGALEAPPQHPQAPPPMPTVPPVVDDPNAPVEIVPCPGCQVRLGVVAADIGIDVECPYCKTVYTARRPGPAVPEPAASKAPPKLSVVANPGKSKRVDDDDDDDRPAKKKSRRDDDDNDDDDDDRPKRRSRRDDDDDDEQEEERPRRKKSKRRTRRSNVESKRTIAGILAIVVGSFGIHKFYLGYTGAGIIMLVLCFCTGGFSGIIALVEGIIYLTKTDEEFIEIYQEGTKEWF